MSSVPRRQACVCGARGPSCLWAVRVAPAGPAAGFPLHARREALALRAGVALRV